MQFKNLAIAALATAANADNTVTLKSMDKTDRTVVWTPSIGFAQIPNTKVPGGEDVDVSIPTGWTGNAYSYNCGADDKPGMLAEFAFDSWSSLTFFDVSAIVNPNDHDGVYQMYPAESETPVSGCNSFACNNAYYLPDDIQTKAAVSNHMIVTLGSGPLNLSTKRDAGENHPREAVTDPHYRPTFAGRFKSALRWARRN